MLATVNSLKELERLLNKQIKNAMDNEVKKVARNTLKENVVEEVYDKYEPSLYSRTGGLLQDSNIESIVSETGEGIELSVRSTREDEGRDVAKIIETGKGYSWTDSKIARSGQERPFHEVTAKELSEKGLAKKALRDGLRKQGLDIE